MIPVTGAHGCLLAGVAAPSNAIADRTHAVDVVGTGNVMSAAPREGCRVVRTASTAVIGVPPDGRPVDERFPLDGDRFGHASTLTGHAGEQAATRRVAEGPDARSRARSARSGCSGPTCGSSRCRWRGTCRT